MRHKKYSYEDAILYGSTADTGNIEISLCFRQTVRQKKNSRNNRYSKRGDRVCG